MAAQRVAVLRSHPLCVTIEQKRAVAIFSGYSPFVSAWTIRSVMAPAHSHPCHRARPDEPHRHPEPENHRWRSAY